MNQLSNDPPIQDPDQEMPKQTSLWIVPTSMLVLMVGFFLTSAILVRYALKHNNGEIASRCDVSQLMEKAKTLSSGAKNKAVRNNQLKDSSEDSKRFFSDRNDAIRWPKLRLTGFGKSADGEGGFAIINAKPILKDQKIGDVKLLEIRMDSVVVEYKGERKTLVVAPSR